jgi:hypothetical protein
VFENRDMMKIFGLKKEHTTGHWRKLHYDLYSATNTTRMTKSIIGNAGHVAREGDKKCVREFWCVTLKAKGYLEDLGGDGRIILK